MAIDDSHGCFARLVERERTKGDGVGDEAADGDDNKGSRHNCRHLDDRPPSPPVIARSEATKQSTPHAWRWIASLLSQ
ncbi:hypothetical protein [Rhodopseudomonas palustris]|uniref:hypothetical protein n=1 Tax=Rhodopseudomonas palustris TaxID=1076 RepID=UPI001F34EB71|nr:hypothetical protein [Rhodopseudomonas palustris]